VHFQQTQEEPFEDDDLLEETLLLYCMKRL